MGWVTTGGGWGGGGLGANQRLLVERYTRGANGAWGKGARKMSFRCGVGPVILNRGTGEGRGRRGFPAEAHICTGTQAHSRTSPTTRGWTDAPLLLTPRLDRRPPPTHSSISHVSDDERVDRRRWRRWVTEEGGGRGANDERVEGRAQDDGAARQEGRHVCPKRPNTPIFGLEWRRATRRGRRQGRPPKNARAWRRPWGGRRRLA